MIASLPGKRPVRVVVISIDGVPYSFVKNRMAAGEFPNFRRLLSRGALHRMNSVQPCVSSVAWASYMTGKNPGKHNIFGFVDKKPGTFETFVPTSVNLKSETIWETMSRAGKRVFVMNVPVTFPPRQVNGALIGCFLSTRLEKATYPAGIARDLKNMGYRLDASAAIARENLAQFIEECQHVLVKRAEAMFHYLAQEPWDFFQCHIMETDRMNHFLWEHAEQADSLYAPAFFDFYKRVDDLLGEVDKKIGDDAELIVLSDHGFCSIKKEIYLNQHLVEAGLLKFKTATPKSLDDLHPDTLAYSLIPGRLFINLQGREPCGTVLPEDYDFVRDRVIRVLSELKDSPDGVPIMRQVYKREDIYHGEYLPAAADLLAVPNKGYDLKGGFKANAASDKSALVGMHTFDDALLYMRHRDFKPEREEIWIGDVAPTILQMLQLPAPDDMDGISLLP